MRLANFFSGAFELQFERDFMFYAEVSGRSVATAKSRNSYYDTRG